MIWKPFDTRFEEILDDMEFHRDSFYQELGLQHLKETLHIRDSVATRAAEEASKQATASEDECEINFSR
jgi:hypothetical protein